LFETVSTVRLGEPLKLLVSAAETSADLHAAQVVAALRRKVPNLRVFGIGGPALREQGLEAVAKAEDLAVMGSLEVISKFRVITAARRALLDLAQREKPELALLVDYPGFHFNVAPKLRAMGVRIAYFIPPKIWVWRKGRVRQMKSWASKVFCILPFEAPLYREAGIPAEFVGSPLVEELPWQVSRAEARAHLGWGADEKVLAVLPGSRTSELANHVGPFLEAARLFAVKQGYRVVVVLPETVELRHWKLSSVERVQVDWLQGKAGWVLRAADLGLIKSGTATLEAAILECPMVVAYRPGQFTSWAVKNLLRYRGPVALANLYESGPLTREKVVPEILHDEVTAQRLEQELTALARDPGLLDSMKNGLLRIRELALQSASATPSGERVAEGLLELWGSVR